VYARAGFLVHMILMDGEFKKVQNDLLLELCNKTAAKEHVIEARQAICTIKEHTRGVIGTLPFKFMPP
jgi:hypothetical protein